MRGRLRRDQGKSLRLAEFLHHGDILPDLSATTKEDALAELVERLAARFPALDPGEALRLLLEREQLGSTGIGDGIALPHAKVEGLERPLVVFGRSRTGIAFDALDGKPVHLFFLLVSGAESVEEHLRLLAGISRMMKNRTLRGRLCESDAGSLCGIIEEQDICM